MWRYTAQRGWELIGDFLLATAEPEVELENFACGFGHEPCFSLGDGVDGFSVEVYNRLKETGQYIAYTDKSGKPLDIPRATPAIDQFLVKIGIGSSMKEVAIPTLPDLLSLLSQLTPICAESRKKRETQ